jgi:hypothetical protein
VLYFQGSSNGEAADPVQSGADGAAALAAIRIATEHTWLYIGPEVSGVVNGHLRKKALRGGSWGIGESASHSLGKHQLRVTLTKSGKNSHETEAVVIGKFFWTRFAALGSIDARPDAVHLGSTTPEGKELLQIIELLQLLPDDCAVNIDAAPGDVFQNAAVGGGVSALVMIGRQAIDRDGDSDAG